MVKATANLRGKGGHTASSKVRLRIKEQPVDACTQAARWCQVMPALRIGEALTEPRPAATGSAALERDR